MTSAVRIPLWQPILVGVLAGVASLSRLLIAAPDALQQMVWAEDGLFPLCVRKVGFIACLSDSFAGYLLTVPRVIAGGVAQLPLPSWPLATNLIAAVLVGLVSAFTYVILRSGPDPVSVPFSMLVALLPATAPIMGFETLGVIASVYTPLLFLTGLAIAMPSPQARGWRWLVAVGFLLCALTIPSAIALVIGIAIQRWARRISVKDAWVLGSALVIGLALQGLVILTADEQRSIAPTLGALGQLGDALPNALLTLIPGITIGPATVLDFAVTPAPGLGLVLALALIIGGTALVLRHRTPTSTAIGLLLLTGIVVLAVPTLTGYPNNRYFAAPVLLWAAAGLLALNSLLQSRAASTRRLVTAGLVLAMVYLWLSLIHI